MAQQMAPFPDIFPRRVYHSQMESRIVRNRAELVSLGSGWANAPWASEEVATEPPKHKGGRPRKAE